MLPLKSISPLDQDSVSYWHLPRTTSFTTTFTSQSFSLEKVLKASFFDNQLVERGRSKLAWSA